MFEDVSVPVKRYFVQVVSSDDGEILHEVQLSVMGKVENHGEYLRNRIREMINISYQQFTPEAYSKLLQGRCVVDFRSLGGGDNNDYNT